MDPRATIFDISRTDDTEWLNLLREEVAEDAFASEDDKAEIVKAIDARCSQLNLLALEKRNAI